MQRSINRYQYVAGELNDEVGRKAFDDVELYKAAIPTFAADNPFITDKNIKLDWFGEGCCKQIFQVRVPMAVTAFRSLAFAILFIGSGQ